ncbi:hypothetical protein HGM15179_013470 [Zosterops borbonicus]|uniref:Uncharacterized protein n=1 Tax=Zosterops borbonicus TaxID=364589 RepID=A0A8K1G901_9PASS|nr:hypothetical protein HGM15179_013470 [Zosterops borbonicus]
MHVSNKQEELETIVQQESCDVFAITKTWWNDSHDWSAATEVNKLFRRDRQSSREVVVALYIRECFDRIESDDDEDVKICKKILCRLFRVFVHVYIHHFDRIILMGAEAHVNTCYKHFYYFVTELNLIDRKELEPLATQGLATIPKCQQALCFQEDSHIFELNRQFVVHCDS